MGRLGDESGISPSDDEWFISAGYNGAQELTAYSNSLAIMMIVLPPWVACVRWPSAS